MMHRLANVHIYFLPLLVCSFIFLDVKSLSYQCVILKNRLSINRVHRFGPTSTTPLCSSKKDEFCNTEINSGTTETEVSRLKFMLHQAKTSLRESEARKEAAECRLGTLEKQLLRHQRGVDEEIVCEGYDDDEDVTMKRFHSAMHESKLKLAQLRANSDSWHMTSNKHISSTEPSIPMPPPTKQCNSQQFKGVEKEVESLSWRPKDLKSQLQQARVNLTRARSEVRHLHSEMMELETRMEKKQLQASLDARKTLAQLQQRSQHTEKTLVNERELLQNKLASSQAQNEELQIHLERTKTESTKHIISVTSNARKQVEHAKREVSIRRDALQFQNGVIAWLMNERKSVRKLFRVQYRIISRRAIFALKHWIAVACGKLRVKRE